MYLIRMDILSNKLLLHSIIDRLDMVMACLKVCVFSMEKYLTENHMKIVWKRVWIFLDFI